VKKEDLAGYPNAVLKHRDKVGRRAARERGEKGYGKRRGGGANSEVKLEGEHRRGPEIGRWVGDWRAVTVRGGNVDSCGGQCDKLQEKIKH